MGELLVNIIMKNKSTGHKKHSCFAILFACLDWRLHLELEDHLKKKYKDFDLCVVAGSLKGLIEKSTRDYFLKQIEISKKLHNSKVIILTMHRDCGAYGGSASFKNPKDEFLHHQKILSEAEKIVSKKFPKSKIIKYFIDLDFKEGKWAILPRKSG